MFGARELVDNERNELGEIGPRLLAAQRAIMSGLPIAHHGGKLLRLAKAELRQPVERLAFALRAGE